MWFDWITLHSYLSGKVCNSLLCFDTTQIVKSYKLLFENERTNLPPASFSDLLTVSQWTWIEIIPQDFEYIVEVYWTIQFSLTLQIFPFLAFVAAELYSKTCFDYDCSAKFTRYHSNVTIECFHIPNLHAIS